MNQLGKYKEYRIVIARRNLAYFAVVGFPLFIYWLDPLKPIQTSKLERVAPSLFVMGILIISIIYSESFRLRLYDMVISVQSIFGFRELHLDEIDSYRLVKHPKGYEWIEFLSKSGARKKHLKVPKECDGYEAAIDWARSRNIPEISKS